MVAKSRSAIDVPTPTPTPGGLGLVGGLGREHVSDIQRARMILAMVDVVGERGVGNATVAHVVARSGVSRRTFYESFVDREDCFLAAFDDVIGKIAASVIPAYESQRKWTEKIRAALTVLLEFLEYDPGMGRLVIVDALGAGPRALEHRSRVLERIIMAVDEGRDELKRGEDPPPLAGEGVVGAVLSVIHTRMLSPGGDAARSQPLIELTGALMGMIVLPYLGPAAARRELARPVPARNGKRAANTGSPLNDLDMRLTYRTVRVLMAIGSHPGVSNKRIGDAAGISDQGQTSKLLARLQHLGLIENAGFGQAKGESNAWHLSPRGQQIETAIREQANRG
jgi:AcrR family transcriptional regulator/DNA-binding MarR family transcriptional regulator